MFDIRFPAVCETGQRWIVGGNSKVKEAEDLPTALDWPCAEDDKVLVEEAIQGREIEVAVLGNEARRRRVLGRYSRPTSFMITTRSTRIRLSGQRS